MIFSIIIPVYLTENYLQECLESIKNQSFRGFECLVIDDGSPGIEGYDSASSQVKKLEDDRFRYFRKENGGQGSAQNLGLQKAKGTRVVVVDADDYLENDYLQTAYETIEKYEPSTVFFAQLRILEDGKYIDFKDRQKFLPATNNLTSMLVYPTWTLTPINYFWRLDIIRKFDIEYRFPRWGHDTCFVWDNLIAYREEFGELNFQPIKTNYIYRQHDKQVTKNISGNIELFEHLTDYMSERKSDFQRIRNLYGLLANLFILRFSLFKKRLQTNNKMRKMYYTILSKFLTLIALLISGVRKA
jgi:glycosyltransferase involved in cell wall biosynthesis